MSSILEAFTCPICLDTVIKPVFNPSCCAHLFCAAHVDQLFDGGGARDCPSCYKSLGGRRNLVHDVKTEAFLSLVAPNRGTPTVDLSIFAFAPPIQPSIAAPPARKLGAKKKGTLRAAVTKRAAGLATTAPSRSLGRRRSSRLQTGPASQSDSPVLSEVEHAQPQCIAAASATGLAGSKRRRQASAEQLLSYAALDADAASSLGSSLYPAAQPATRIPGVTKKRLVPLSTSATSPSLTAVAPEDRQAPAVLRSKPHVTRLADAKATAVDSLKSLGVGEVPRRTRGLPVASSVGAQLPTPSLLLGVPAARDGPSARPLPLAVARRAESQLEEAPIIHLGSGMFSAAATLLRRMILGTGGSVGPVS